MRYLFFIIICVSALISCTSNDAKKTDATYLGGEIINPVQSYVLIKNNLVTVDSIPLDRRNRFLHKLENIEDGLYTVHHGESQIIYIEEGDSIMMRVNTKEFDESLIYSGYGADKSNYLIDLFLHWEEENKTFTENYQKNPENFQKLIDSMTIEHQEKLEKFLLDKDYTDDYIEVATAASQYDNYQRKEWYPFGRYGKDKFEFIKELPEGFYDFRNKININDPKITQLYAVQRYIDSYLDHQAFLTYGDNQNYDRLSYIHNLEKVGIIDSLVTNNELRERLLNRMARLFIANSNNDEEVKKLYAQIKEYSKSEETLRLVDELYTNNKAMQAGNTIPDMMLVDQNSAMVTLSSRITKPTVLYFWSYNSKSRMDNTHRKVTNLKDKYPEFNFIGINMNTEQDKWLQHLAKNNYKGFNEYRFENANEDRKKLVINDLSKTIVLDKNGRILNSHANLHNSRFENDLLAYLNQ